MGHYQEQYDEAAEQARYEKVSRIDDINDSLGAAVRKLTNTRGENIAKTHIETAMLWLEKERNAG